MQLPDSNHCGVSIITLSTISDWCQERGIASVPVRKTTVAVFTGLPGNYDALPLCTGFSPRGSGWWAIQHTKEEWLYSAFCSPWQGLHHLLKYHQQVYIYTAYRKRFISQKQLWQTRLRQCSLGNTTQCPDPRPWLTYFRNDSNYQKALNKDLGIKWFLDWSGIHLLNTLKSAFWY